MIHILHYKNIFHVFHLDQILLYSVAYIKMSPQSHVAFFLPLLSSWFLQNISFLNSPFHPFLPSLSNFFTTHILVSVSFFQTRVASLPDFYFSEPLLLAVSAPHTRQYRVSSNLSFKPRWFDISKNPSTSVDISKTVSVEISRYAIYLYKRGQRNKKIHGLEPGLPVCSLFSQA